MRLCPEKDGRTAQAHDTVYERKVLILLSLGFGLVGLDRWLIAPLFPHMMRDLGLNFQQLGNLFGILSLTWGLWAIVAGPVSDRIGRKKILVATMIGFSLLSCVSGLATSFASLMVVRALMGVTEGAFTPVSVAAVGEASLPSRRGLNQGLQLGMFSLFGMGVAPVLATQLLRVLPSWHWVFVVSALPGLIVALLMWRTLRDHPRSELPEAGSAQARPRWTGIFRSRNVWLAAIAILCAMAGMFVISAMVPIYLVSALHVDTQKMGFISSAIGFGGTLGLFTVLIPSDYVGRRTAAIYGFLISAVLLFVFARTGPDPVHLFVLLFFISAFGLPMLGLLCGPIATEAAPAGLVASSVGFVSGIGEIFGGGLAPAIAGFIAQHFSLRSTLDFAAGALMVGGLTAIFLIETAPRRRGAQKNLATGIGIARTPS